MRKILLISAVIGVIVACSTLVNNSHLNVDHQDKWKSKAPALFNNAGYSKLMESANIIINNVSESQVALIGKITNSFGIRDDILEYIIKNIPNNNESAIRAAIKLTQYRQQIYYGNPTELEALALSAKEELAIECLSEYLQKPNEDIFYGTDQAFKVVKMLRNNKARDAYMWDINRKYFSWKVLGTGLTMAGEKIACAKGEF